MQMKISNVEARCDPQLIVDQHRKPSSVDINPTDIIKSNCSIDSHKLLPAISATSTESSDQSPDHATVSNLVLLLLLFIYHLLEHTSIV